MPVTGWITDARMLHINPNGFFIWRPGDTGNFGTPRTDQKAAYLATDRVSAQHLIGADFVHVGRGFICVGEYPQAPGAVECEAVRG